MKRISKRDRRQRLTAAACDIPVDWPVPERACASSALSFAFSACRTAHPQSTTISSDITLTAANLKQLQFGLSVILSHGVGRRLHCVSGSCDDINFTRYGTGDRLG